MKSDDVKFESIANIIKDPIWYPSLLGWNLAKHIADISAVCGNGSFQVVIDIYEEEFYNYALMELDIDIDDHDALRVVAMEVYPDLQLIILDKIKTKTIECIGYDEWIKIGGWK